MADPAHIVYRPEPWSTVPSVLLCSGIFNIHTEDPNDACKHYRGTRTRLPSTVQTLWSLFPAI